jgi:hypothetical protein
VTSPEALPHGVHGPYLVCGWKVTSAIPLPELLPWRGDDRQPDVTISCDHIFPEMRPFWLSLDEQGVLQMQFPGVTLSVLDGGRCINVHVDEGCDPLDVRNYLYGSGLAALCYRHGLLPLHGSAVRVGNRAVIFTGNSGSGKSTLATAMARHGHRLLCDDVCALEFSEGQPPVMRAAFPRVKLLGDAIEGFGFEEKTEYTESPRGTKGHFGMVSMYAGEEIPSLPVAAIYLLSEPSGEEIDVRPVAGHEAFRMVGAQVHRSGVGELLGQRALTFSQVARLLSYIPVYKLERPRDFSRLDETVEFIVGQHTVQAPSDEGFATV